MTRTWLALLTAVCLPCEADSETLSKGPITEWLVPWEGSRPRDPYVAGDGLVWFVGQTGDYAASFDAGSGEFHRFDLPKGTGPHNLIVAADRSIWYAGNRAAHIGRLDPALYEIVEFHMPDPDAVDPHTLAFDPKGKIWFTVQHGNFVGRLDPDDGDIRLAPVPTAGARPYGIDVDDAGRPWIVLLGTNKLATVDPVTFDLHEITLPRSDARPRRIGVASDGIVWYVDYALGYLGRYDPETGEIDEWEAPSARRSGPYGLAIDDRDRVWFVETWASPNHLVGFDPESERFFSSIPIPSGGGSVRHMYFDPAARAIWFGTDTNYLARFRVPE